MSGLGPNDVNFRILPLLEGPILLQPIFLKNLRTPIQRNTTYVVVPFSLTHKGNFSIVLPIKSKVLSKISNDFDSPLELLVSNYSRRWRVENAIAEAVKFFNLNALSSPILVKVHFDVIMTMIADTLYSMLAKKLRGFEDCDAPKIYRHFVKGKGKIVAKDGNLSVIYPKRAHNPILRAVPWHRMPRVLNWLDGANLDIVFP